MSNYSNMTDYIHSGTIVDPLTKGTVTPIYLATANGYLDAEENIYPRYFNLPNQRALQEKLATLEKGEAAIVFSSGMAAISTTLFSLLRKGDHAVFQIGLYGGTTKFILSAFDRFGIEHTFTKGVELADFQQAIKANTKLIYVESPSNPLLGIVDLAGVAKLARSRKLLTVIDNTFASPRNQNPLQEGIDIVVHSATKYLGGHSDICAGAVVSRKSIIEPIRAMARHFGGSLNAETCALLERSIKTLAVRVDQQNKNAQVLAEFLQAHAKVENIYFPGLPTHPGHEVACKQMHGFGGMVSFELSRRIDPRSFQESLKLISPSLSLGGVETTVCSPLLSSHAELTAQQRAEAGIKDSLLRLSVGIEDPNDLIADLQHGIKQATRIAVHRQRLRTPLVSVRF